MTHDEFEQWWGRLPESKLELIDGKLIVGNSLSGSQLLFRMILEGWGAAAVVALVDRKLCWEALKVAYPDAPISTSEKGEHTQAEAWASQFDYQPSLEVQLSKATSIGGCGQSIGPDFVMHLGNSGITPDILLSRGNPLNHIYNWYMEGPADLVIEVILPAHGLSIPNASKLIFYASQGASIGRCGRTVRDAIDLIIFLILCFYLIICGYLSLKQTASVCQFLKSVPKLRKRLKRLSTKKEVLNPTA